MTHPHKATSFHGSLHAHLFICAGGALTLVAGSAGEFAMRKGGSDSIGGFLAGYRRELTPDDSLQGQVMLGETTRLAFPAFLRSISEQFSLFPHLYQITLCSLHSVGSAMMRGDTWVHLGSHVYAFRDCLIFLDRMMIKHSLPALVFHRTVQDGQG